MKALFTGMAAVMATMNVVIGQTVSDDAAAKALTDPDGGASGGEVRTLDARLMVLRRSAMESPEGQARQQALREAERGYRIAVAGIAEVRALDRQLSDLRVRMGELLKQRQAAIEGGEAMLATARKERDLAQAEFQKLLEGGEEGRLLMQRREALIRAATSSATGSTGVEPVEP